ncbi:MAG: DUF86 domain-containing protein [Candidatus Taylorbacteria bacterium]|nr:DUF86 domain-containing protein [Candidatus Taylorbacteria bacterium]
MTPLKIETIQDKLFKLNEHAKFIDDIIKNSDEKIVKDTNLYYSLEHLLQLSIQIILDIGTHILAEEFGDNPKTYAEVIVAMGERDILDKEFAISQEEMAKFRNKLIHDYDSIDKSKTLLYARKAPEIFRTFGRAFVKFVEKKK